MTTALTKTVARRSEVTVRDGSKRRRLIVSVHPGGFIGLRMEKCRREETLDLEIAYSIAVKQRVAQERAARKAARKGARSC